MNIFHICIYYGQGSGINLDHNSLKKISPMTAAFRRRSSSGDDFVFPSACVEIWKCKKYKKRLWTRVHKVRLGIFLPILLNYICCYSFSSFISGKEKSFFQGIIQSIVSCHSFHYLVNKVRALHGGWMDEDGRWKDDDGEAPAHN